MSLQTLIKKMCPFVEEPLDDCYCSKRGGQDIVKTLEYCNDDFTTCDIYQYMYLGHDEELE